MNLMDKTKGTPRERRRERTRTLILQAAESLLAEGGLQKLTMAELAHRADYSKPAIYEYFGGIEDILIELTNTGFIRLGERVKEIPKSLPPDERLVAVVNAILQFANENFELYQLMFTHIIFSPGRLDQHWQDVRDKTQVAYLIASEVIKDGIDQGIFKVRPGFDHDAMVYQSWVVVHGMASLKSALVREVGLEKVHNQDQVIHVLLCNLKGIPPEGNNRTE
jgi:AcrR family transcriptional regulator